MLIELVNRTAESWWSMILPMAFQGGLLGLVILIILKALRGRCARLASLLITLTMLKFLLNPYWLPYSGVFSWTSAAITWSGQVDHSLVGNVDLNQGDRDGPGRESSVVPQQTRRMADPRAMALFIPEHRDTEAGDHRSSRSKSPGPKPSHELTWKSFAMLVHGIGILSMGLIMAVQWRMVRSWMRLGHIHTTGPIYENMQRAASTLGIVRLPRLATAAECSAPLAFGLIRPAVLLPQHLEKELREDELRCVLAHELVHHQRHDLWLALVHNVALCMWWFHPVVWWMWRASIQVREECCDDHVLRSDLSDANNYCSALVRVVEICARRTPFVRTAWIAAGMHPLGARVSRILDLRRERASLSTRSLGTAAAAVVLLAIPGMRNDRGAGTVSALPTVPIEPQEVASQARALDAESGATTKDLLENRDFYGDVLPAGAVARIGSTRFRSTGGWIDGIAFAKDAGRLVSYQWVHEATAAIWDADSGKILRQLNLNNAASRQVLGLAISPDGSRLAVGVYTHDFPTRKALAPQIRILSTSDFTDAIPPIDVSVEEDRRASMAISVDNQYIAFAHDQTVEIIDLGQRQSVASIPYQSSDEKFAFSPTGSLLAISGHDSITLWEWNSNPELIHLDKTTASMGPAQLRFSPDGTLLAATQGDDACLRVFDVAARKRLWQIHRGRSIWGGLANGIEFSEDGKLLAVSVGYPENRIDFHESTTGTIAKSVDTGELAPYDIDVSLGQDLVAARGLNSIGVWRISTGQSLRTQYPGHESPLASLAFSPDGRSIATSAPAGFGSVIQLWDADNGELRRQIRDRSDLGNRIAFSPDASRLAIASGKSQLRIFDVATGAESGAFPEGSQIRRVWYGSDICFDSSGTRLDWFDSHFTLRECDAITGKSLTATSIAPSDFTFLRGDNDAAQEETGRAIFARIAHEARRLVLIANNVLYVLDLDTGAEVAKCTLPDSGEIQGLAVLPNTRRIAITRVTSTTLPNNRVEYTGWLDIRSLEDLAMIYTTQVPGVYVSVVASPDESKLAIAHRRKSEWGLGVEIRDTTSWLVAKWIGPQSNIVMPMAFSPDSQRLAVGHSAAETLIYDLNQLTSSKESPIETGSTP